MIQTGTRSRQSLRTSTSDALSTFRFFFSSLLSRVDPLKTYPPLQDSNGDAIAAEPSNLDISRLPEITQALYDPNEQVARPTPNEITLNGGAPNLYLSVYLSLSLYIYVCKCILASSRHSVVSDFEGSGLPAVSTPLETTGGSNTVRIMKEGSKRLMTCYSRTPRDFKVRFYIDQLAVTPDPSCVAAPPAKLANPRFPSECDFD
jgi:hypothetical protein